jgi:hypothetical protein
MAYLHVDLVQFIADVSANVNTSVDKTVGRAAGEDATQKNTTFCPDKFFN